MSSPVATEMAYVPNNPFGAWRDAPTHVHMAPSRVPTSINIQSTGRGVPSSLPGDKEVQS